MLYLRQSSVAMFLISVCFATDAFALAGKHPATEPMHNVHGWPDEVLTAINSPGRVAGHWVNGNNEFFYQGDDKALGELIRRLAETKFPLTLVVHTASQRRSLLFNDDPIVPYDWSLLIGRAGWVPPTSTWKLNFDDPKTQFALRVDVWLDDEFTLDAIDLPAGVRLSVDRVSPSTTQPAGREASR